nr:restriction endonuclease [Actinomycetota bacterium]
MKSVSEPDEGITPGRDSDLLPTPSLSPDAFEDFTERLLSAHRHVAPPARHVARVERWGRRGDKQDGIDFEGTWSDDRSAAWQCKRLDALTVPDVKKFIKDCTFTADEYYIVYSGEASRDARDEVKNHPGWAILDRRGLGQLLADLPLHLKRSVLDDTWGPVTRRQYLETPGEDSFIGVHTVHERRLDAGALLNDLGAPAGRADESTAIDRALDRTTDWPLVVLVSGRGGAGKTRLLVERLTQFQEENLGIQVLWLSPGRSIDADALRELPHTPAVIVIDDAHRLTDHLRALLEYAKHQPGTQIVLGSRGPGISTIRAQLVEADVRDHQVQAVSLKELTSAEGRALVDSLLEGMTPPFELRIFLAEQARRSPFLAVLTVNLLRAGKLSGPLNLDAGLREKVMVRYRDVVTDGIAAESQPAVRRMLATVAAVGTVNLTDADFRHRLSKFSGIPPMEMLRTIEKLREHDVLIGPDDATQYAVEMLGDQILEAEAVVGNVDTGFALELWDAFKTSHRTAILSGLGNLAWRLGQIGRSVIVVVWTELEREVTAFDRDQLLDLIGSIRGLAYAQPEQIVELISRMIDRLDELHKIAPTVPDVAGEREKSLWFGPATREAVDRALAPVVADAAVYNADVLEQVLEILWSLAEHDDRPPAQYPQHPLRLIADRLVNIGELPDPSYPARTVQAAQRWLAAYEPTAGLPSPLAALTPLLAKEGTTTEWENRRTLRFKPFLVSAGWARPVRDQIRSALVEAAADGSALAFEAVRMLGDALRPPMGMFGAVVPDTTMREWDDDDLATLDALAGIASRTSRPAIRRLIRQQVEWDGLYSKSAPVRRAALALITELDERPEDDLSDYLRNPGIDVGLTSRRGIPVPSIDEVEILIESEADRPDDFETRYAAAQRTQIETRDAIAKRLWPPGEDALKGIHRLDEAARELTASGTAVGESLHMLFAQVLSDRPDLAETLFRAVVEMQPGPLDDALPQLLDGLRIADEPSLVTLIDTYPEADPRVRTALGRATSNYDWLSHGPVYTALTDRGRVDEDPTVRRTFLTTVRLDLDPIVAVQILIEADADEATVRAVIRSTMYHGEPDWSALLTEGVRNESV